MDGWGWMEGCANLWMDREVEGGKKEEGGKISLLSLLLYTTYSQGPHLLILHVPSIPLFWNDCVLVTCTLV